MKQSTAIVLAAVIGAGSALIGTLMSQLLVTPLERRRERRQGEQEAVTAIAGWSLHLLTVANLARAWFGGPKERMHATLRPFATARMLERIVDQLGETFTAIGRAHGELLIHGRAQVVDLASPLLDAAEKVVSAATRDPESESLDVAQLELGRSRLRLLEAARRVRGKPSVFDVIR